MCSGKCSSCTSNCSAIDSNKLTAEQIQEKLASIHAKCTMQEGNIKTGKMFTFSKLYGNENIYCKRLNMVATGTCRGNCEGCKKSCYVRKSYRYDSVKYRHMINTLAIRSDLKKAFQDIESQISRKRVPIEICRIHQSGEFETAAELYQWCMIAIRHPSMKFFAYAKSFDIVIPALLSGVVPDNFTVLISVWHNYGIAEYMTVAHLNNVKAFVYDDHAFDYAAHGLNITTYCKAYNAAGKLDHELTCIKCRKCFDNSAVHKVIGCAAHD